MKKLQDGIKAIGVNLAFVALEAFVAIGRLV